MSKLAALLVKLQAKAEARRRAEGGDGRSSSSSASSSAASSDSEEQVSREEGSGGDASVYGSLAYWDARYETGEIGAASGKKGELSNEWFVGFNVFQAAVEPHMPRQAHVLVVGNGLSLLAEDLVRAGWRDVCAIDYSDTCTQRMRERASSAAAEEEPCVSYRTMDVTALQYESGAVTTVLDKATLDTMFNADDEQVAVNRMLDETHRVLAPGGKYVVVSYGEPEDRLPALQQPRFEWTLIDQATLRKNNARFYVYVLLKAERS